MQNAKILIVEDEWIIANDIEMSLKKLGYNVIGNATSGEDVLKILSSEIPDLVLMDIVLPGEKDGIEFATEIKKKYQIPVIYLTAYGDEKTLARAKISEPFGYIIKPFKDNELYSSIEIALYNHRMSIKIKEREMWLSTVLKAISDGVIITDEKGCVIFMNPVAMYLTGWKETEVKGKPLNEVFISESIKNSVDLPKRIEIGQGIVAGLSLQGVLIDKNGSQKLIENSVAQMKDEHGKINGVVIVFREIVKR